MVLTSVPRLTYKLSSLHLLYKTKQKKKAVLSQIEPRDAAENFNRPTVRIEIYNGIVRAVSLPQHGFLVDFSLLTVKK